MLAHRIETTIRPDGTVLLDQLPFQAGEAVEIIILAVPAKNQGGSRYPLRGTSVQYDQPTEPVTQDDNIIVDLLAHPRKVAGFSPLKRDEI